MPNRIIRESCRTSPTLDQLSDGAERMFWRLTTVADDFGRFEADPRILLSHCFPLKAGKIKLSRIQAWYSEMESTIDPITKELDPLITSYIVHGKKYGLLKTFEKHNPRRASKSKYPEPTDENICQHMPADSSVFVFENRESRIENRDTYSSIVAVCGFDEFWKEYPKKKSKGQAEKAYARINPDEQLQGRILAALKQAKTSEDWAKEDGRFIPHPATWLNAKGWEDEFTANGKPQKTFLEMVKESKKTP